MFKQLTRWTINRLLPYGTFGLFILAFCESSFFPVPPDILLVALALIEPKTSFFLAAVTTIASVMGGMFGYFIGLKGGKPLLRKLISDEKISQIHNYFAKYDVWAVGIAALTPIPYKVFTIAGGVFYINFLRFVLVSIIGRGARFFLVGWAVYLFGQTAKSFIAKHFDLISIILVLVFVVGFYTIRFISKRKKRFV